ncbi:type IV pilus assembly protein PilM [Candidatus Microgenomates bacterium]|nr:type IV pilus assembly protein PilM [Candidatus Microgenomates bacterium]MBI2622028.1 type IV pilus assembly protein PilM [Candidatus Microgenomates bacterium]
MPKKVFGLDIGTTSIKAVEIAVEKSELRLVAADEIPTPPRGLASESDLDQQLLAGTIKKLIQLAKIDTKFVNTALPEAQVFTRVIEMPILSEKELVSAIKWESEQYIPLPESSISLDWEILRKNPEKNNMDVLLVGAPMRLVAKYQKIMELANLEVVSMETELLAASHSLVWFSEKNTPTILMHIGANSTNLGIFKDGMLVVGSTIPSGGNALTRAIAGEFGFETTQAEEYKKTYGLEKQAFGGKIVVALQPVLTSWLAEIKKAISFYQNKQLNSEIKRIIISGGGAKLPGLAIFFADSLGIEAELGNPWKHIKVDPKTFETFASRAPAYVVATGLALREYG